MVSGIKFCSKQILRTGVVLYGFKLTFQQVLAIGLPAITADLIIVAGTLALGILMGKLLKVDSQTALMTSTGSAICGAAAVLGAEPVVRCEAHKTAVAVSTVVIFGTLSMFLYPIMYRAGWLDGLSDQAIAVYIGSTLHEVAHVVGAGNAIDAAGGNVADAATIAKMIRVMLLAPVLVIMSVCLSGKQKNKGITGKSKITIPWFAFYFLVVIGINSLLQSATFIPQETLQAGIGFINNVDTFLLTMAMTALGAETSIDKFKQAGAKPFYLAGIPLCLAGIRWICHCKIVVLKRIRTSENPHGPNRPWGFSDMFRLLLEERKQQIGNLYSMLSDVFQLLLGLISQGKIHLALVFLPQSSNQQAFFFYRTYHFGSM